MPSAWALLWQVHCFLSRVCGMSFGLQHRHYMHTPIVWSDFVLFPCVARIWDGDGGMEANRCCGKRSSVARWLGMPKRGCLTRHRPAFRCSTGRLADIDRFCRNAPFRLIMARVSTRRDKAERGLQQKDHSWLQPKSRTRLQAR